MKRILVIGSSGQLGSELVLYLRARYIASEVVAGYVAGALPCESILLGGPCVELDVRDAVALSAVVRRYRIDTIYNLASLLSVVSESRPMESWDIGVNGMLNVLEVSRELGCGVFSASSIAVFGFGAMKVKTPQWSVCHPVTIYGITKVATELLSDYYYVRYGVDARSVRYPGIISSLTLPGGGTTDYAIGMLRAAAGGLGYECPISCDTYLDMLYMPDALEGAVRLMEADGGGLLCRNGYNITSMSVSPGLLCSEIRRYYPNFVLSYVIDSLRESIACSWPDSLDDGCARAEWGWDPKYGLVETVRDMLNKLR